VGSLRKIQTEARQESIEQRKIEAYILRGRAREFINRNCDLMIENSGSEVFRDLFLDKKFEYVPDNKLIRHIEGMILCGYGNDKKFDEALQILDGLKKIGTQTHDLPEPMSKEILVKLRNEGKAQWSDWERKNKK
jgi:hypothetical protein